MTLLFLGLFSFLLAVVNRFLLKHQAVIGLQGQEALV